MRTAFVTLLLLLLTSLSPTPAGAADNGEWSVRPADSTITPRAAFELPARPGTTLTDRAVVTNTTAAELTFRLYVADAHNTERDGGLAVRGIEETQRDVGAWGKPEQDTVTVPARSAVTIGITLTVPRDAPPGDHVGALVAVDTRVRPADGSHLGVQRGVGARIYLRVEGPEQPGLAVEDVRFTARSPQIPWTGTRESTASYTLHNTGNVKLTPRVSSASAVWSWEGPANGGSPTYRPSCSRGRRSASPRPGREPPSRAGGRSPSRRARTTSAAWEPTAS